QMRLILLNKLIQQDIHRNQLIINTILNTIKNNTRAILLVTFRTHRDYLYNELKKRLDFVYLGTSKSIHSIIKDLKDKTKYIILSTDKLLNTGFDMTNLNTIHVGSILQNQTSIIQTIGRIERSSDIEDIDQYNRYLYIYDYLS